MHRASRPPVILAGLIFLWGSLALSGYLWLESYHASPGESGSPPRVWPEKALPQLDRNLPTLLIFIHPCCPCSTASLAELSEVAVRCQGRYVANLVSFQREQPGESWERVDPSTNLAIPGLLRWTDPGGCEARRFGVKTSGHVLLYSPSGRLVFSGGITVSRGHQGSSRGLEDLIAIIMAESIGPSSSPVFGCSVVAPELAESGVRIP